MNAAAKKLNSSRGASMLMALLMVLVVLMVSGVIVSAAVSAAVNLRNQKERQQAYLTVSSAAQTFRESVLGDGGKYQQRTTVKKITQSDGSILETTQETYPVMPKGPFYAEIQEAIDQVVWKSLNTYRQTYTIEIEGQEAVELELLMQPTTDQGSLTGVILTGLFTTGVQSGHPCKMTLTMEGELEITVSNYSETGEVVTDKQISWNRARANLELPKSQKGGTP